MLGLVRYQILGFPSKECERQCNRIRDEYVANPARCPSFPTDCWTAGDTNVIQNFGEAWLAAFRGTDAFAVWDRITDPVIFDIVEPRCAPTLSILVFYALTGNLSHPCDIKVNALSDLGLRLSEGIHDLRLDKNLEVTKEAISNAITTSSTSIFKAFEGVRNEVSSRLTAQRANPISPSPSSSSPNVPPPSSLPVVPPIERRGSNYTLAPPQQVNGGGLRPLSLGVGLRRTSTLPPETAPAATPPTLADTALAARATLGTWGSGIGGFISSRAYKLSSIASASTASVGTGTKTPGSDNSRTQSRSSSVVHVDAPPSPSSKHGYQTFTSSPLGSPTLSIRDLDKEREEKEKAATAAKRL